MAIYRLLENMAPQEIELVTSAFEDALAALITNRNDPIAESETLAKKIIEIVQAGERDPIRIRTQALNGIGNSHPHSASEIARQDQGNAVASPDDPNVEWNPIASVPFNRDLELSVIERGEVHALTFSCRRTDGGWINAETKRQVEVRPTHWREWI